MVRSSIWKGQVKVIRKGEPRGRDEAVGVDGNSLFVGEMSLPWQKDDKCNREQHLIQATPAAKPPSYVYERPAIKQAGQADKIC